MPKNMYMMPAVTKSEPVTLQIRAAAEDRPVPLTDNVEEEATVFHLLLREDRLWINRLLAHVGFFFSFNLFVAKGAPR